jgi:hypothetical protein
MEFQYLFWLMGMGHGTSIWDGKRKKKFFVANISTLLQDLERTKAARASPAPFFYHLKNFVACSRSLLGYYLALNTPFSDATAPTPCFLCAI